MADLAKLRELAEKARESALQHFHGACIKHGFRRCDDCFSMQKQDAAHNSSHALSDVLTPDVVLALIGQIESLVILATKLGASEGQITRAHGDRLDVRRIQDEHELAEENRSLRDEIASLRERAEVAERDRDEARTARLSTMTRAIDQARDEAQRARVEALNDVLRASWSPEQNWRDHFYDEAQRLSAELERGADAGGGK